MADAGFEKRIDRPSDALRWALGTRDMVDGPSSFVATPVASQRAIVLSSGQSQAAQITSPAGVGARVPQQTIQLPLASGGLPFQGLIIGRKFTWLDAGEAMTGTSETVVIPAGDFSTAPGTPPLLNQYLTRVPGEEYVQPLWYALIQQGSNTVRLWDLRNWVGRGPQEWYRAYEKSADPGITVPAGTRYNQTIRGMRVPQGRTGVLRVSASAFFLFADTTAAAGYLRLEVDGELHPEAMRFHSDGRVFADRPFWNWDVPLSEGSHTTRAVVTIDSARSVYMRDLQSSVLLEVS